MEAARGTTIVGCGREWRAGRRERESVKKGKDGGRRREGGETKATRGVGKKDEQGENKKKAKEDCARQPWESE